MEDEKYISITFNRWNSYYKPLEEINKRLEAELKEIKERNRINIYIETDLRMHDGGYVWRVPERRFFELGFITVRPEIKVEELNMDLFIMAVKDYARPFKDFATQVYWSRDEVAILHHDIHTELSKVRQWHRKVHDLIHQIQKIAWWKRKLFGIQIPAPSNDEDSQL